MTLTKADISQKVANDCGFMKGEASEIIEKMLEIMKSKLIAGEDIMISGFGKWHVRSKRPRRGRNPQSGQEMILDARRVVTWKYSPVLKKIVNKDWGRLDEMILTEA
ncbi:MAG: integration host factor subunit alpha [Desulfomonilaceae bacterium]